MSKEKELIDCPECGSSDVGGSNNMVYCYNCQHEVRAITTAKAVDKWNAQVSSPLKRIECQGVGDNNGFFEFAPK